MNANTVLDKAPLYKWLITDIVRKHLDADTVIQQKYLNILQGTETPYGDIVRVERSVINACSMMSYTYSKDGQHWALKDPAVNGCHVRNERVIAIRPTLPIASMPQTILHEFAHAMDPLNPWDYLLNKQYIEAYTDLAACLTADAYGIDTSDMCAFYIACLTINKRTIPREQAIIDKAYDLMESMLEVLS